MSVIMNAPFNFSEAALTDIEDINSSFAKAKLKVMYTGANPNKTYFSKDAVIKALPSMKNVPIVCHWDTDEGMIGGHDVEVYLDKDGSPALRNLTEPCGVVPEHYTSYFAVESDDKGVEHEYLYIDDLIMWKRQDVFKHIVNDLGGKVSHSMEIIVHDMETMENGTIDIKNFEFTALCLLEADTPCFSGSELEVYSTQGFKAKMEQMMKELRESYIGSDNIEGGDVKLQEKNELAAKYGIDPAALDFSMEDFSVEELTQKFEAIKAKQDVPENTAEQDYTLASVTREALMNAVETAKTIDRWGDTHPMYLYRDYDPEKGEVYAEEWTTWKLYGFKYTMNGDAPVIDFESKTPKKYEIVDFEGEEQPNRIAEFFSAVYDDIDKKLAAGSEWESKYTAAQTELDNANAELAELREYKAGIEAAADKAAKDELLGKFSDLAGVEEFAKLSADAGSYSVEDLEEKCYAIRGRNMVFSKKAIKSPKIMVDANNTDDDPNEPYNGIVVKYGKNKDNK